MKNRILMAVFCFFFLMFVAVNSHAETITFKASDVITIMATNGAPLSNGTNQWGLWAVRVMPIVTGGVYTITGGTTTQDGWGVSAPNGAFGATPYTATNSAWFWDASGAEAGYPANPLYMIMSQSADTFTSYFGNVVTAVNPASTFTFSFTLGDGATWDGSYQFVVDGSKYTLGTSGSPGGWVADFFGGYGSTNYSTWFDIPNGGLNGNSGAGYYAPVVYSSTGFFQPPADVPLKVKVKKNRVIPFKTELLDASGAPIISLQSPPVIQVWFSPHLGEGALVNAGEYLSAGQGTEGNMFVFSDGKWQFNLQVKGYSAGTYIVQMVPGGSYVIDPLPTATFVVE